MIQSKLYSLMQAIVFILEGLANAGDAMIAISLSDPSRWNYFSDQVMGGVSQGQATFEQSGDKPILRLTGKVSTANRGGFIQARTKLDGPLPETACGVFLDVRGNDQTYFVHLRTTRTILPWQFYQASFVVSDRWHEVRLPFEKFPPQGRLTGKTFDVRSVRSLAVAAFGRDHRADLSVRAVGFY
jgi:hypothetical protein